MHTLQSRRIFGLDPASDAARRAIALVAEHGRWEHDGLLEFERVSGGATEGRQARAESDPRMAEAVEHLRSEQQPDGRWLLERTHPGRVHFDLEDGVGTPSRWNTLRSLRVLDWWERGSGPRGRPEACEK